VHALLISISPENHPTRHRLVLFFLALLLLSVSFEPLNLYPFVFVGMIPYFRLLENTHSIRQTLKWSFIFGWVFSLGQFYWVHSVLAEFSKLPFIITFPLFLLFACIAQMQFLVLPIPLRFLLKELRGRDTEAETSGMMRLGICFLIAAFYAGWDWLLPKLFVDTFGIAFTESERLKQLVDLGGPSLLTFLIVFINLGIYLLLFEMKDRKEPSLYPKILQNFLPLAVGAVFLFLSLAYGEMRLNQYRSLEENPERKISGAIIQANIGDVDKIAAERGYRNATRKVMETYYGLSEEILKKNPKTEVLFWPETSYPSDFGSPSSAEDFARDRTLIEYAAQTKVPIVFGGYFTDENKVPYNAAFYLEPTSDVRRYFKTILLWFGETIPGADFFPWIRQQFPMVGFFGRGPGPINIPLLGVATQPLICYEVLFPNFTAEGVRKGAKLILNFTNDSWFGEHGAPYYHFRLAQLRSVETRTPQVRITNTGFSALILPSGGLRNVSGLFTAEAIPVEIPILAPQSPTLMVRYGDWFSRVSAIASLIGLLALMEKGRRRRKALLSGNP
jgi:apolipoprotein N-acyltransferase